MNKCFMDTVREKTNLEDSYGKVKNIPPLLICPNQKPRIQRHLLESSVLLADIDLGECYSLTSRNYNDTIYQRNQPFGQNNYWSPSASASPSESSKNIVKNPVDLKIPPRPILTGFCGKKQMEQERNMIDEMNKYTPNKECNDTVFVPGKGPINHYFDNIDVESQLKNINEIDTKCSAQFFKVNPNDNTPLGCYKDNFVKDYQKCEAKSGYTWCDYVDGVELEQFPVCDSQEFVCGMSQGSRKAKKITAFEGNNELQKFNKITDSPVETNIRNIINNKLTSGQMISEDKLNRATKELYLIQRKRELDTQINMIRKDPSFSINRQNITQYKSDGISNIIAPTIINQEVNEEYGNLLGERTYIEGLLEKITYDALNPSQRNEHNQNNQNNQNNVNNKINENCFRPINEINLAKSKCVNENKNLYRFRNLVGNPTEDCNYCEELFNNFTKRKTIVPNDSRFTDN